MSDILKTEIQAANARFMAEFAAQSAEGIGALYTTDCKVMPTGADVMMGRDAATSVFGGVMKMGATKVLLEVDEVGPMGSPDMAYERSHYTFSDKDGKVMDHGKYVVIWKKVGGIWQLYIDIFNSNNPPSK